MKYLFPLLLLLMTIPSQAEIISRDFSGKAAAIRLDANYKEDTGTGNIQIQLCPTCRDRQLVITPETELFKRGKPVNLNKLKTYLNADRNASMHLQYHKYTKQVFSIDLQPKNRELPQ